VTYPTDFNPISVATADLNADNKLDIIVANTGANNVGVLLNIGNGTFIPQVTYSTGSFPSFATGADVNGDGKSDIIVANTGANNVGVLRNTGNGTFAAQVIYPTGMVNPILLLQIQVQTMSVFFVTLAMVHLLLK